MFPLPSLVFPQEQGQDGSLFHKTMLLLLGSASQLCSALGKEENGVLGATAAALQGAQSRSPELPHSPHSTSPSLL